MSSTEQSSLVGNGNGGGGDKKKKGRKRQGPRQHLCLEGGEDRVKLVAGERWLL